MNEPTDKSKELSNLTHEKQLEELAYELERLREIRAKRGRNVPPEAADALINLFGSPPQLSPSEIQSLLNEFDALISAGEQVQRAVVKKNRREGIEALADFFVAFKNIFAAHTESFRLRFPRIQSIEHDILGHRLDDANCTVLAFIAHFRMVREKLAHEATSGDACSN